MEILDPESFFERYNEKMLCVGFMQAASEAWFPFCLISDHEGGRKLDTLCVSRSFPAMSEMVKEYAARIPQVKNTFVQYLLPEEVRNLMGTYGVSYLTLVGFDGSEEGCGCGCGCS